MTNAWVSEAVRRIERDFQRSADTHLFPIDLPALAGVQIYLKDESTHPTGSLKHRLARSLFLYALCNGWVREGSTIVEASSGSTAVSEAYFARLLGLPFVAVMPRSTSPEKVAQIEFHGGRCHFVDSAGAVYDAAREVAARVDLEAPAESRDVEEPDRLAAAGDLRGGLAAEAPVGAPLAESHQDTRQLRAHGGARPLGIAPAPFQEVRDVLSTHGRRL